MSMPEKLVQESAKALSRRSFLKGLGAMVAALGLKLAGGGQPAKAAGCCHSPECAGCNGGGTYCPTGYTTQQTWPCCVDFRQWTCKKCYKQGANPSTCYCSHDDYIPGMCCPNPPCHGLQPP